MCILFIYDASEDTNSDYQIILAANRDEFLTRLSKPLAPWNEDSNIYGGRDLEYGYEGGTWLALNPVYKKLGVLLNLPGKKIENAISRGKVVADYVKCESSTTDYVETLKKYDENCNEFILVTVEFGTSMPSIKTYCNSSRKLDIWTEKCLGFGNCLPDDPLMKVKSGKDMMENICKKFNKVTDKKQLIEELIGLLKNQDRHLPDHQLESRQPMAFKELSSIFVELFPSYGTRAHTIFLLSKKGHVDLIELSLEPPTNAENPNWNKTSFEFTL